MAPVSYFYKKLNFRYLTGPWMLFWDTSSHISVFPAGNYMFKVNNRNPRTKFEIYSKLTINTPNTRWVFWKRTRTIFCPQAFYCVLIKLETKWDSVICGVSDTGKKTLNEMFQIHKWNWGNFEYSGSAIKFPTFWFTLPLTVPAFFVHNRNKNDVLS